VNYSTRPAIEAWFWAEVPKHEQTGCRSYQGMMPELMG
jgi:hypothetical protein